MRDESEECLGHQEASYQIFSLSHNLGSMKLLIKIDIYFCLTGALFKRVKKLLLTIVSNQNGPELSLSNLRPPCRLVQRIFFSVAIILFFLDMKQNHNLHL